MDIRKLQRAIVDGLEDVKAQDIQVFNTEHLSALFERVIVASGTSNRQTKALAASVRDAVKSRGLAVMRTEGEDNGEWIIVDCGAAVAHIMQPAIREYYHLEELWGGKSVKMKYGEAKLGLVKAAEPDASRKRASAPKPRAKPAKPSEGPSAGQSAGKSAGPLAAKSAASKSAGVAKSAGASGSKASAKRATAGATSAKPKPARKAAPTSAPTSAPIRSSAAGKAAPKRPGAASGGGRSSAAPAPRTATARARVATASKAVVSKRVPDAKTPAGGNRATKKPARRA